MMKITKQMRDEIPDALYSCADGDCATEVSYSADDLSWFSGNTGPDHEGPYITPGFYCCNCEEGLDFKCDGPSMDEVLRQSPTTEEAR